MLVGEAREGPVTATLFSFDAESVEEQTVAIHEIPGLRARIPAGKRIWLNIDGLHDVSLIEAVGREFNLHPLVLEDLLNVEKRPKQEEYERYLFVIVRMLYPHAKRDVIASEQVSILFGDDFVLSFQEEGDDVFGGLRERLRTSKSKLRRSTPDYLAYSLIDAVVDSYFAVLERLGDELQELEEEVVALPHEELLPHIQRVKRAVLHVRRAAWPQRELLAALERNESALVTDATRVYLRDVYDHAVEILDIVEAYREVAHSLMEMYLSSVSNRTNSVMMTLTLVTTIFMPRSFIAGVYGMNFRYMPELEQRWGYPAVLGAMLLVAVGMAILFTRRGWIRWPFSAANSRSG